MQAFGTSFPPQCIVQPFCGIGKRSLVATIFIKQVLLGTCIGISFVDLYAVTNGYWYTRLLEDWLLVESAPWEGSSDSNASDNQWQGRNSEFYVHSCKYGWQRTIETREFPKEYQRKALCRQRIYRSGIVWKPVLELLTKIKNNMKRAKWCVFFASLFTLVLLSINQYDIIKKSY